jgi:hypothetical protein
MDFREATDSLFDRIDHEQLAKRMGVSIASIRQARLRPEAGAHRSPPGHWRATVLLLAAERINHYNNLIAGLENDHSGERATRRCGRTQRSSAAAPLSQARLQRESMR